MGSIWVPGGEAGANQHRCISSLPDVNIRVPLPRADDPLNKDLLDLIGKTGLLYSRRRLRAWMQFHRAGATTDKECSPLVFGLAQGNFEAWELKAIADTDTTNWVKSVIVDRRILRSVFTSITNGSNLSTRTQNTSSAAQDGSSKKRRILLSAPPTVARTRATQHGAQVHCQDTREHALLDCLFKL
ncbi:unnamed protein product [Arctogadus glacialis]